MKPSNLAAEPLAEQCPIGPEPGRARLSPEPSRRVNIPSEYDEGRWLSSGHLAMSGLGSFCCQASAAAGY